MNRLYITILLALFVIVCQGQNIRSSSTRANKEGIRDDLQVKKQKNKTFNQKKERHQKPSKRDTVYAIQTAKQHGWFIPLGTLTKEQTKHRYSSVMFTGKNKRGHWTKVETINAYGGHSKGQFLPYILSNGSFDDSANKEWLERLAGNCIIELVADPRGDNVVQERVYDENHNLLYVYSRTPIGVDENNRNQYIGSYKDMYGLPAEMRKAEGHTYGTIVKITEDKWGNDSIIEYLDAKGVNKLNADSVFRSVHIYDKTGHKLRFGSQNDKEEFVIDSWGNCGVIQTWNDDHTMASAMYTDSFWQPMRMPSENSQEKCGTIKVLYKYDEYKREDEEIFVDANDNPMTNVYGCHKIKYEYDIRGNIIKQIGYDIEGRLSQTDASGIAVIYYVYDDAGRTIESTFLDKNNMPNGTKGYLSKRKTEYDADGTKILAENYSAETGEEKLCYQMVSKPDYKYTLWSDGTSRIDSLDNKGRTTYVGYYGADGKHEMYFGSAYERYTYIDQPGKTKQTQVNYDQDGNIIDTSDFAKEVTLVDSVNWSKTIWRYDKNGVLTDVYIQRYTPYFDRIISQDDANSFGVVTRCGGNSSVRYYKGNVMYNQKREDLKITHLYGVDEFGEPDYITSSSVTYYYTKSDKYYDVNNNETTDNDTIKDKLPKVMTIEVIDSCAYDLGLKDNDVILLYGDYAVDLDTIVSYFTFRQDWTLRTVLDADKIKRMVVFRITDASKKEYGLYEISNLKGTCSELGFLAHIRYLTDKQLDRIKESINKEMMKSDPSVTYHDFKKENNKGGSNYVILAYPEMYRSNRYKPYAMQVTDPSILLGTCIKDRNMKWTKENGDDIVPFEQMLSSRTATALKYPRQDFFVTKDGMSIKHIALDEQGIYTNWIDAYISDEDYEKINQLYDNACDSINTLLRPNDKHKQKLLLGNWKTEKNDSLPYQSKAFLSFSKDKTYKGGVVNYGKIHFKEGDAVYKIAMDFNGKWHNSDNWLFIYPEKDSISLSCVDLLGAESDELRQRVVDYMNSICESNKEDLLTRMKYDENKISNEFYDVSIIKNIFEAKLESGSKIVFTKTKDKYAMLDEFTITKADTQSKQNIKVIDKECSYIGNWQCTIPDFKQSFVEVALNQSGQLNIDISAVMPQQMNDTCSVDIYIDMNINGEWYPTSTGIKTKIEPSKLNVDCNFVINGLNEVARSELIPVIKESFESQKQQLALSLLKGFKDELPITEIDSLQMVLSGNRYFRIPDPYTVVLGSIEDETGYLAKNGYTGHFVVLEWCDWNCRQSLDEYEQEFKKQKENAKHLVLLPVEFVDDKDVFKDVIELDCPNSQLGLRLVDRQLNYNYFKNQILSRYIEYRKTLKQQ